ncbi:hypothetical protein B0E53_02087 [Micromonospora sp. MH33]|uniref:hypothetical protein n=1 Tax=Micromonospora sp. MH33 TaxID=1945509 RepID=UPI000D14862C|nr:hypothetical protein [Micromonospora sp. MH33]PSK65981.1 hypothetical protein B0E53_02087 [Micromonospora sp. MH33]
MGDTFRQLAESGPLLLAVGAAALAGGGVDRPVRAPDAAPPDGDRNTTSEQEQLLVVAFLSRAVHN